MDIKVDFNVDELIKNIELSVSEIEDCLKNLYNASITLNDENWNTKESEKYEQEYLSYLKNLKELYPLYLKNYLEFFKNTINKYREIDLEQKMSNLDLGDEHE